MLFLESDALRIDALQRGLGESVLLVHSAGMGAAQWRAVIAELASDYRCVAPNLRGYGRSSPWPSGAVMDEEAELELLEAVARELLPPVHVVGHSMGAWLGARLVRRAKLQFASLSLLEPVTIGLLREAEDHAALADIGPMLEDALAAFARGDAAAALRRFTDYWTGPGAWERIPAAQRLPIFVRAAKMNAELRTLWADRATALLYADIRVPVLIISAANTTLAGRRMADMLEAALANRRRVTLSGAGHMAPITHPLEVAALLRRFLSDAAHSSLPSEERNRG